ncbi:hypothetical protein OROMI_026102 [Orobanche minor]
MDWQVVFASHESSSSSFKFSSILPSISPNLPKRKTDHQIRASFSTSHVQRHAERRNKGIGNNDVITSLSTGHWSSPSSKGKNKQQSRGSFDHNDENEALNMQQSPSLNSPKLSQVCSMGLRPSELRLPSPQIGFFDENTPPRYHDKTRSRKMPQKVSSEGSSYSNTRFAYSNSGLSPDKKFESPYSKSAKNIKRPKTSNHMQHSSLVTNKKADDGENENRSLSCSQVQLGNDLSRYFAAIDLNQEKTKQLRKNIYGLIAILVPIMGHKYDLCYF